MLAHMKTQTTGALTDICVTVPTENAESLCKAINSILELANFSRPVNGEGEELYTEREVFPEGHPGMALRGLRTREDITQKELAARLGKGMSTGLSLSLTGPEAASASEPASQRAQASQRASERKRASRATTPRRMECDI